MDVINDLGLSANNKVFTNLSSDELVAKALEMGLGKKTAAGAFVVETGEHTGRAAKDKYVVSSEKSETTIDWANDVNRLDRANFDAIKKDILASYESNDLFVQVNSVGADEKYNMNAVLVTPSPTHALFMNHMFRDQREKSGLTPYTCLLYTSPSPRDKRQSRMPSSA